MKRNIQTTDCHHLRSRSVGFAIRQQRVPGFVIQMLLFFMMMVMGTMESWATDYYYFIVNKSGKIVTYAKTTNQTSSTPADATAIPPEIKSVNATNWRFYNGDQLDFSGTITLTTSKGTIDCSLLGNVTMKTTAEEMNTLADSESSAIYPNYIFVFSDYLDSSVPDLQNGTYYTMQFHGNSTYSYVFYNGTTVKNTSTTQVTDTEDKKYFWCFKASIVNGEVDPYDIKIYNALAGTGSTDFFVAVNPATGSGPESTSLVPKGTSNPKVSTYYVISGHGDYPGEYNILGNPAYNGKLYYNLWAKYQDGGSTPANYTVSGLTNNAQWMWWPSAISGGRKQFASIILTRVTYTYKIVDASGNTIVQATTKDNTLDVPDVIKSPFASYNYFSDAACTDALSGPTAGATTTIYVRYTTSGSLDLNGGTNYYMTTNDNFVYASSVSAIGIESSIADPTDNNYKWKITGNDAYQLTLQNVNNSKYITYDVSSGEAVPTLSDTGGKFFLHEGSDGKYEVVAATTNDFSTTDYYTLGVAGSTLKLYSKTNYPLGSDEVQTVLAFGFATITTAPAAVSLTYDATEQSLVSAGVAENGTMQYSLGDEDHYSATIPTAKNAGTYDVYYKAKGSSGYFDWEPSTPISVTITKAALTVTPDAKTKVYGDEDPALTFTTSGLLGSDTEADALTGSLSRTSGQNVNEYDITQGNLTSANYDITLTSGVKLTITPAGLSITAEAKSKGYGDADPELTYTTTGLKFEDTAAGVLSGALIRAAGNNVGTYAIEQGTLASNSNYTISYTGANFTITPKSLGSGTYVPANGISVDITKTDNGNDTYSFTPSISHNGTALTVGAGNDYTVTTTGDATTKYYEAIYQGVNNYTGTVSAKFVNVDFHPNSANTEWAASFVIGTSEGAFATPTGYTAHIVTGVTGGNVLTAPSLSYIPEDVPVILLSTASSNGFMAQPTSGAAPTVSENKLAVSTGTSFTAGQIYILYNGEFVLNAAGTLEAGKIYLPKSAIVSGSTPAPSRLFIDWGESTGLNNSQLSTLNSPLPVVWYTLDGRRLNGKPMKKGLYLRNGQKIVVR